MLYDIFDGRGDSIENIDVLREFIEKLTIRNRLLIYILMSEIK